MFFNNLLRSNAMRILLSLVALVFCFGITMNANEKEVLKQKITTAKEQVASGVSTIKGLKEQSKTIKEGIKAGTITKEDGKKSLQELRNTAKSTREEIKDSKAVIRDSRKELREMKKARK